MVKIVVVSGKFADSFEPPWGSANHKETYEEEEEFLSSDFLWKRLIPFRPKRVAFGVDFGGQERLLRLGFYKLFL